MGVDRIFSVIEDIEEIRYFHYFIEHIEIIKSMSLSEAVPKHQS